MPVLTEGGVVTGNVYDKYNASNPIARAMMSTFLADCTELVAKTGATDVHEVGCGEGRLSLHLASQLPGLSIRGSDFSRQIVEIAVANALKASAPIRFEAASVYTLTPKRHAADLVVCCEVLEHLEDPVEALRILSGLARKFLLLSVPREPLWRALNMARLQYLPDLGNTPGHLNHWSSPAFVRFASSQLEIVEVRRPLPWTMLLCRPIRRRAS